LPEEHWTVGIELDEDRQDGQQRKAVERPDCRDDDIEGPPENIVDVRLTKAV